MSPASAPAVATTVRALVMEGPGVMVVRDRPAPPTGPGDAVLQVVATGICGSDIHGLAGATGRRESGQVMGHETVGRVVEVGADVDDDWLGALATVNPVVSCGSCAACLACEEQQCEQSWVLGVRPDVDGAFAERITVPGRNVVRLPESMTPEHGALVEPLAVGYHALVRAAPRPDDTVLVIGGGPIGQAAALAARRVGVRRVLVSEPNPARASILQRLGVRVVDPGSLDAAVRPELGDQPSIVIDAVGSADTLQTALTLSRRGARIVLVGMASPQLGFAAYHLSAAERTVIGTFCYSADDFRETAAWVARHPEVGAALTGAVISLDEAPEVFGRLAAGELLANKILVSPGRR